MYHLLTDQQTLCLLYHELHFCFRWISVLNNCKEAILLKAFGDNNGSESNAMNQRLTELTGTIIAEVRRLPGNNCCCDCGAVGKFDYSV